MTVNVTDAIRVRPRIRTKSLALVLVALAASSCANRASRGVAAPPTSLTSTATATERSTVPVEPQPTVATTPASPVAPSSVPAASTYAEVPPIVVPTTTLPAPSTTPSSTTPTVIATPTTATAAPTAAIDERSGAFNPVCARVVAVGETLELVAKEAGVDLATLWAENGFAASVIAGSVIDVCPANGVDDITGDPLAHSTDEIDTARLNSVKLQQAKLNELFAPFATSAIEVDGISGPRTRQHLCAARLGLGLPASTTDMQPGTSEEASLLAAASLSVPPASVTEADRWALIDRTCQIMFVGSTDGLVFVFPTSTGSAGFETREQEAAPVFRFNPALDNGGWHNSSEYPVGVDNPRNGNLYKPLYFDTGQAIHGALNVPPTPRSKGCARLSVEHQEALIAWLGLGDVAAETWVRREINLRVGVQGTWTAPQD